MILDRWAYYGIEDKVNNIYNTTKEDIIRFNDKFKEYATNYTLLCVFQKVGAIQHCESNQHENIDFLYITTPSRNDGLNFERKEDTVFVASLIKDKYTYDLVEADTSSNISNVNNASNTNNVHDTYFN